MEPCVPGRMIHKARVSTIPTPSHEHNIYVTMLPSCLTNIAIFLFHTSAFHWDRRDSRSVASLSEQFASMIAFTQAGVVSSPFPIFD